MNQDQFVNYEQGEGFKPGHTLNVIPALDRINARLNNADQAALQQLKANNAQRVKNSAKAGEDLMALSKMSKTLTDFAIERYKQSEADKETGEMYDALTGGYDFNSKESLQEQKQIDAAADNADLVASTSQGIEQETGDIAAGEAVSIDFGDVGRGFTGEKAALMKAQVEYPAFISAFMNSSAVIGKQDGQEITVQDAVRSGDSRLIAMAVSVGRRQFIQQNGLHKATKRQFVKMMGNTIINADSQVSGSVTREAIKANREAKKSALEGQGYNIGQSISPAEVPTAYRDLADLMWKSNAYPTRGAANEAALDSFIEGMTDRGDVDGLQELLTTEKIEGNSGTQLSGQYRNKINDAIVKAEKRQGDIISAAQEDIEASMYERLAGVNQAAPDAIKQRDAIIEDSANQLEQAGDYKGAAELRSQRNKLSVSGNNQRVNAELQQQIMDGEIVNQTPIDQAFAMGQITNEQRTKRLSQLEAKNDRKVPSNPIATDLINSYSGRFTQELGVAAGLKRDAYGNFIDGLAGDNPLLSAAEAKVLQGQAKVELRILANQILRNNPGIEDQDLNKQLSTAFEAWWKAETQSKGGKYQLNDLIDARNADVTDGKNSVSFEQRLSEAQRSRLKDKIGIINDVVSSPTTGVDYPQDLTKVRQLGGFTPAIKGMFNPLRRDKVFTQQELKGITNNYKSGVISEELQETADQLGMTPLSLLQQQLGAYGLKPVMSPKSSQQSSAPISAVQGAQRLMTMGFPKRGASWLSGNIQQESTWVGSRQPWQDGANKAGGLASWNGPRLQAIQQRFGKPISEITSEQQLSYMTEELKRPVYAEANRIFRNPYSTDRQLIRASKQFWGYEEEGSRYQYARQIEQTLSSNPQAEPALQTTLGAVSSSFGMDTREGPDNGRNACVYAINKVLAMAGVSSPWGSSVYVPKVKSTLDKVGTKLPGPVPGAIVIMRDNGNPPYPHIGIVGSDGMIVSNSSSRGRFDWKASAEEYERYYGRTNLYYSIS